MTALSLTAERLRQLLAYDTESGSFTRILPNHKMKVGSCAGWKNGNGYLRIDIDGHKYYAHRLAWLWVTGSWPAVHIDHADGNTMNNRFSNLREATQSENMQNRHSPASHNTSGFLGVEKGASPGKWAARIAVDGRRHYLGVFANPEEAHAVYLQAKSALHPFGKLL